MRRLAIGSPGNFIKNTFRFRPMDLTVSHLWMQGSIKVR
jgi:hypothetical protein